MTIIQLEYLIAVANHGSFSAAAVYCNVTQPSLSTQIKNLEEELGVPLFIRGSKKVELTQMGRGVLERAKGAVACFYGVREHVSQAKGEVRGKLRIAAIPTIAPYLLHRFIPTFVKQYPEVELNVREMTTSQIIAALHADDLDIGIAAAGFFDSSTIIETPLFDDNFYLYASGDNEMLEQSEVSIMDVDASELMLLAEGHCLRTQILDLCNHTNPLSSNLKLEGGTLESIIRMVDKVGGATILPGMAVDFLSPECVERSVRPFKERRSTARSIALVTTSNFIRKGALEALKETIINSVK